jgi:folylpolyglutamate synthase/dihydropteroate synthase
VDVEGDLGKALELGRSAGGTTLVTGSFHTVGDAMSLLQIAPLP